MSVWFCSDLHFGHKNIQRFRPFVKDEADNRQQVVDCWNEVITKRDDVYVLGDAAFTMEAIDVFHDLPGRKFLVRGNHDTCDTSAYLKVFSQVYGLFEYKEFWLSHAPIHPDELRGKVNLHGHVHYETIRRPFNPAVDVRQMIDGRYFNCCVENVREFVKRPLISLEEIRECISIRHGMHNVA
jgi:calcineurin-like phosphoesterase family protein